MRKLIPYTLTSRARRFVRPTAALAFIIAAAAAAIAAAPLDARDWLIVLESGTIAALAAALATQRASAPADASAQRDSLTKPSARAPSVIDTMAVITWTSSASGEISEPQPTWSEYTGQPLDRILRGGWLEVVHPEDRELAAEFWREALRRGDVHEEEYRVLRRDGEYRRHRVRAAPRRDSSGRIIEWHGMNIDVTEAARTHDALSESEATLSAILDALPVGVVIADRNGKLVRVNAAHQELWGMEPQTRSWEQYNEWVGWWPDTGERIGADEWTMARAVLRGEVVRGELVAYEPFGQRTRRYLLNNAAPIRDASGQITGGVLVELDVTSRRAVEEALERANTDLLGERRKLEAIIRSLPVGVSITDPGGSPFMMNEAALRIHGFQSEADMWTEFSRYPESVELRTPDGRLVTFDQWPTYRAARGDFIDDEEFRLRNVKRGLERVVAVTVAPVADQKGKVTSFVCLMYDVTERKRAELGHERSRALLDAVLNCLPAGVVLCDPNGRLLRWNRANERLWGLEGRNPTDTADIEAYSQWQGWWYPRGPQLTAREWALARALEQRKTVNHDVVEIQPFNGAERRITIAMAAPVLGPSNELLGAVAVQTDVTEQMRTLETLENTQRRLELALRSGRAGLFEWQVGSERAIVSGLLREISPADPHTGEVAFEAWRRMIPEEDAERIAAVLQSALAERRTSVAYDFRLNTEAGQRWMSAEAQILFNAHGLPERVIGVNYDITDRKQLERSLQETDRRKDEFLATLAHELRNPLAPLRNALQILNQSSNPTINAEARAMMGRQLKHMVRLVDDLLDISRISVGKLKLQRERLEVQRIVEQAIETARTHIDARRHRLIVEPADRDIRVVGDAVRLAQVLTNLLNNAAKYSEPGGTITVRVRTPQPDRVQISVQDTGIGIAHESLPRAFELFSQIEHDGDKTQGGLGIGLALARRLAEMHGGSLTAYSAGVRCGSTFTLELPIAAALVPSTLERRAQNGASHAERCEVVVADDNRDAADSLAIMLKLAGHEVSTCYDGRAAINLIRAHRPRAAILDLGMPGCDGFEVARTLRNELNSSELTLIALTGWGQDDARRRTADAGFDHHFTKPAEPDAIRRVLDTLPPGPAAARTF